MPLESATYVNDLNSSNPPGTDARSQGDDHIRLLKAAIKATFPSADQTFKLKRYNRNAKSGGYTAVAGDDGKVIDVDASGGAVTIALTAAATLGDGWGCFVRKSDSSVNAVTIDPNAAETINGAATLALSTQHEAIFILCTGAAFYAVSSFGTDFLRDVLTTRGDILTRGASLEQRLALGTSGWLLSSNGTDVVYIDPATVRALPRSYLAGYGLANNSGDATNDLDIAIGAARDSTNAADITLASALTKQLDAAWAVGTNAGGRDTGAIADGVWHVWVIKRSDTGVVDALFSLSATAPTMPANYDYKRRLGSILRISATIRAFKQQGDRFYLDVPINDANGATEGAGGTAITVSAPPNTIGIFGAYLQSNNGQNHGGFIRWSALANTTPTSAIFNAGGKVGLEVGGQFDRHELYVPVDSSRQVFVNIPAGIYGLSCNGWLDNRGRND